MWFRILELSQLDMDYLRQAHSNETQRKMGMYLVCNRLRQPITRYRELRRNGVWEGGKNIRYNFFSLMLYCYRISSCIFLTVLKCLIFHPKWMHFFLPMSSHHHEQVLPPCAFAVLSFFVSLLDVSHIVHPIMFNCYVAIVGRSID
jgi:hypothetical protein